MNEVSNVRNDQTAFSDHIVDISNHQGPSTAHPEVKELVQSNVNEEHKVVTFDETANNNSNKKNSEAARILEM